MEQLQELLTAELRDLYDAEKQLVKALPESGESGNRHRTQAADSRTP
jgi:ferritin-like metal-binding protein YciE